MKLAIVCTMYGTPWGGSEELWNKVAEKALLAGDEVFISTYDWGMVHPKIQALMDKGATVYFRKRFQPPASLIGKVVTKIQKKLSRNNEFKHVQLAKPDVICVSQSQTYDVTGFPNLYALLLESNIPYFLISHFNYEHQVLPQQTILAVRKLFQQARTVFFVSERNKKVAERQIAADIRNGLVVFSPFNLTENKALPLKHFEDLTMACVARLDVAYKGHDLLFQALASDKWKQRRWALNLYGHGDDLFYLQQLVSYYNLQDKIHFKGHVNSVQDIWLNNQVLILPSLGEGTPLSLFEAMVCARAAVLTDVGGGASYIKSGVNGYVIAAPVPGLIDETLEKLWADKDRLEEMGLASREIILGKMDFNSGQTLLNHMKANRSLTTPFTALNV